MRLSRKVQMHPYSCSDYQDEFDGYLSRATRHFLYNTKSMRTFPDYSSLPVEILQMIAYDVAETRAHEETEPHCQSRGQKISVHLFKLRLVCRTLSCTATSVFVALTQQARFDHYKTLFLPPQTLTLSDLAKTFNGKDKTIPQLITRVVYQITTSKGEDIDTDYLNDAFHDVFHECSCHEFKVTAKAARELVTKNVRHFLELCSTDNAFANTLCNPKEIRHVRTVFSCLRKLKIMRIEVEEFWNDMLSMFVTSPPQHQAVGILAYRQGVPAMLEQVSKSSASWLQVDAFGSHAWAGFEPMKILKLGRSKNFLANIKEVDLTISHRDDYDMQDWMNEPELGLLRRSDRINIFLSCLKSMTTLMVKSDENETGKDDAGWFEDVLHGQSWPRLEAFVLKWQEVRYDTLDFFFSTHHGLNTIDLYQIVGLTAAQWCNLLDLLRDHLNLEQARITLNKNSHIDHVQLSQIISDYDKDEGSRPWVDVGDYVVEVLELE